MLSSMSSVEKATDKTLEGEIHCVLRRSNKLWCPYADEWFIMDEFQKDQKERTKASWQRANAKKKKRKQQKCDCFWIPCPLFFSLCHS